MEGTLQTAKPTIMIGIALTKITLLKWFLIVNTFANYAGTGSAGAA